MLLVARKAMIDNRHNIENAIRGTLKVFGLKVGMVSRLKFSGRVRELVADRPAIADTIGAMLTARECLMEQYHVLHRKLKQAVREDEVCQLLMTAQGRRPGGRCHLQGRY